MVKVPPFDLGLAPPFGKDEPLPDERNNRLTQRVPFDVSGSYDGCPVNGFAWSELLANWYGWEDRDPWFTGGKLPKTPKHCGATIPPPPSGTPGELNPPAEHAAAAQPQASRTARANGETPRCEYDPQGRRAASPATAIPTAGAVTITRPGQARADRDPRPRRARRPTPAEPCARATTSSSRPSPARP